MISVHKKFISESLGAILGPAAMAAGKQALVWGGSSALASKLSNDKPKSLKEKKEHRKKTIIGGVTGAAAGALGSYL